MAAGSINMTMENKRRAIFTVLSEVLHDNSLWDVMWYWQENYSDKPQFELNHFLADCASIPEISENRSWLYRQLIGVLMDSNSDLKPDPWPQMNQHKHQSDTEYSSDPQDDWSEVFTMLMNRFMNGLRSDSQYSLGKFLLHHGKHCDLPKHSQASLNQWLANRELIKLQGVKKSQLKSLLNACYIATCELIGPVEADKVLSTAIRDTHFELAEQPLDVRTLL